MRSRVIPLVVFGVLTSAYAEETKWAAPNVVGMPGYHESVEGPAPKSEIMKWDIVAGNWKRFTGSIKQKWGQLTDDELTEINGQREQLEGLLQAKYGYSKAQAQKEIDDWIPKLAH
jgi:uncharacterized protein YjbJ (UPF0337 family)